MRLLATRRSAHVAALGLAAALALPVAAAAAYPVPPTPAFGPSIDPLAGYVGQSTCDPVAKLGTLALRALVLQTYRDTSDLGIVRDCAIGGTSEHKEGRAWDWGADVSNPTEYGEAQALLNWLLATDQYGNKYAMARRLGIMYMIYDGKIWGAYAADAGWRPYTGSDPHTSHVHISLGWPGADKDTTFWTAPPPVPVCDSPSTPAGPAAATVASSFVPVTPARLLDTRTANGVSTRCRLGAARRLDLQVTGRGGVPSSGVAAAVLNVAAVAPSATGYLSVYPAGMTVPRTSSLNPPADRTTTALVTVPVGAGGQVSIYNRFGDTDVIADVIGYYRTGTTAALFHPVTPRRAYDTGDPVNAFRPAQTRAVSLAAIAPAGASGAVLNVAVASPTADGYVTLWPSGKRPLSSTINFAAGQTVANRVVTGIAADRSVQVFNSSGSTRVVIDVTGWFGPSSLGGLAYYPVQPRRIMDTRTGLGARGPVTAGKSVTLDVVGPGGVPDDRAGAAVYTLTATGATASTYITAWPGGRSRPLASDVNAEPGVTVANLAVTPLGGGAVSLFNASGSTDLLADLVGYYR
jgi:hypothetical protein